MLGAVIFYVWYVYTAAVYEFIDFCVTGALYPVLKFFTPLTWIGAEGTAVLLFSAPILFFVVTVIVDLLPAFTKVQKVVLTVLPIVSYALFLIMEYIANTYFRLGASY